jgi:catalase
LSKLTVPAIRERMLSSLRNASEELASAVAQGLGMPLPAAMPRALENPLAPEITKSPALSLMARPGEGGIRTRKVAILVADGVEGAAVAALQEALLNAGAVPVLVAPRLGQVSAADGSTFEATGSLENSPSVLFDAVALPDGEAGVATLARLGQALEFIAHQYRHGKTLLVLGAAKSLIDMQGISLQLPSGEADPGIVFSDEGAHLGAAVSQFLDAVAKHRHPAREVDPPPV